MSSPKFWCRWLVYNSSRTDQEAFTRRADLRGAGLWLPKTLDPKKVNLPTYQERAGIIVYPEDFRTTLHNYAPDIFMHTITNRHRRVTGPTTISLTRNTFGRPCHHFLIVVVRKWLGCETLLKTWQLISCGRLVTTTPGTAHL